MWAQFRDGECHGEEAEPVALGSSKASLPLPRKWQCPMASGDVSAVLLKQTDRHHLPRLGTPLGRLCGAPFPH